MSIGKLYVLPYSPRSRIVTDIIKYHNLDIEVLTEKDETFNKAFPVGKTPAFIGPKGFKLHECIAILLYLLSLVPETKLLGKNKEEYASVIKYLSFANSDLLKAIYGIYYFVKGYAPYNKKVHEEYLSQIDEYASVFEARLLNYTYLVGERFTIADAFAAYTWSFGLNFFLGKPFTDKYPNVARWIKSISKHSFFETPLELTLSATAWTYTPPKKEKKAPKEQPKKEAAPKAAAPAEEPAAAPKPKHPLEALGKPKAPLDEWKRIYSNEETREKAIPWFWENQFNAEEWSLWKVDYKYNDELTLTFMSNNLVGGFFNRLSASTKYIFGCMVVYGENNNNGITGAFLVRGQDYEPAFNVAPDWESYSFTKLDPTSEETKKFVNNMLAWDEPVEVNGEKREIADGKVCK